MATSSGPCPSLPAMLDAERVELEANARLLLHLFDAIAAADDVEAKLMIELRNDAIEKMRGYVGAVCEHLDHEREYLERISDKLDRLVEEMIDGR